MERLIKSLLKIFIGNYFVVLVLKFFNKYLPAKIILIIANLLPFLLAIIFHWDLSLALFIHWLDLIVFGGFHLIKISISQNDDKHKSKPKMMLQFAIGYYLFLLFYLIFFLNDWLFLPEKYQNYNEIIKLIIFPGIIYLIPLNAYYFYSSFIRNKKFLTTKAKVIQSDPLQGIFILHLTIVFGGLLGSLTYVLGAIISLYFKNITFNQLFYEHLVTYVVIGVYTFLKIRYELQYFQKEKSRKSKIVN
ncbi:MAG: DUF6498-containing protein [bacterium]